jgi:tripartite-type tricarboxylate transporter receptor subunit TctC
MKLPRRQFLRLAAGAAAFLPISRIASAQSYPSRPVRIIAGLPAGGIVDLFARLMGQWLSERLGRQFVIENRTGASGNLAIEAVAKSPPDGYALLMIGSGSAISVALHQNLKFNFITDIAPVASLYRNAPSVVVVNPSFPAKTLPEFIAYARANPGKLGTAKFESCNFNGLRCGV